MGVVADGAGSAMRSELGAKIAVETAIAIFLVIIRPLTYFSTEKHKKEEGTKKGQDLKVRSRPL
ncbi:MAG: protein phosphatase 2C domain-containing protein [Synechocystis sp.]|nr:protein phosphatase 2C domain-containing protein [Synechocystis sp.]